MRIADTRTASNLEYRFYPLPIVHLRQPMERRESISQVLYAQQAGGHIFTFSIIYIQVIILAFCRIQPHSFNNHPQHLARGRARRDQRQSAGHRHRLHNAGLIRHVYQFALRTIVALAQSAGFGQLWVRP
jgi:hypothetical protein